MHFAVTRRRQDPGAAPKQKQNQPNRQALDALCSPFRRSSLALPPPRPTPGDTTDISRQRPAPALAPRQDSSSYQHPPQKNNHKYGVFCQKAACFPPTTTNKIRQFPFCPVFRPIRPYIHRCAAQTPLFPSRSTPFYTNITSKCVQIYDHNP